MNLELSYSLLLLMQKSDNFKGVKSLEWSPNVNISKASIISSRDGQILDVKSY